MTLSPTRMVTLEGENLKVDSAATFVVAARARPPNSHRSAIGRRSANTMFPITGNLLCSMHCIVFIIVVRFGWPIKFPSLAAISKYMIRRVTVRGLQNFVEHCPMLQFPSLTLFPRLMDLYFFGSAGRGALPFSTSFATEDEIVTFAWIGNTSEQFPLSVYTTL